ncbi:MAG: PAS domain-containing protein, partial [Thermomicrobiaceae bacterium]|nr:PAS domain-containing protein [Thermomicrobiaceae bacterium]
MALRAGDRERLRAILSERCEAVAEEWCAALSSMAFAARGPAVVRPRIGALTERVIDLLLAEPLDQAATREIGAALVELGFHESAALNQTHEVLGHRLVADLPPEERFVLQDRLVTLLGAVAAGFIDRVQTTILAEQERVRAALLTAHQETEAALRATEARLRLVVDHAPLILFAFDRAGVITLSQGRALAALGYRPGEGVGRCVWKAVMDAPAARAALQRALAGEACATRIGFRGRVFETCARPLRDDGGAVSGVMAVAVDVTEWARAEVVRRSVAAGLSPAEQRVLPLLARQELSYRQLGARLALSRETVRDHMQAIAAKLGVE